MKPIALSLLLCLLSSACAAPIAAWKGRAYGEHSLNPGSLITMSGTFRTGRVSWSEKDQKGQKVVLCLEPLPEVAALMGGTDKLTWTNLGLEGGAMPVLTKGHDSSARYQEASLAYTIACNEMINGVLTQAEYKAKVNAIVDNLTKSIVEKPEPAKPEKN
jgi:hypothetical protein